MAAQTLEHMAANNLSSALLNSKQLSKRKFDTQQQYHSTPNPQPEQYFAKHII